MNEIYNGHWDIVLHNLQSLKIPKEKLFDVYEQVKN